MQNLDFSKLVKMRDGDGTSPYIAGQDGQGNDIYNYLAYSTHRYKSTGNITVKRFNDDRFIIYSYNTPIGYGEGRTVLNKCTKFFSNTTSKHQSSFKSIVDTRNSLIFYRELCEYFKQFSYINSGRLVPCRYDEKTLQGAKKTEFIYSFKLVRNCSIFEKILKECKLEFNRKNSRQIVLNINYGLAKDLMQRLENAGISQNEYEFY